MGKVDDVYSSELFFRKGGEYSMDRNSNMEYIEYKNWEYTEILQNESDYKRFCNGEVVIKPTVYLKNNTAVYVQYLGKRTEGVVDLKCKGIRKLKVTKSCPNSDIKLYLDALNSDDISIIAVDGLMGTGKTSTAIKHICEKYLNNIKISDDGFKVLNKPEISILICKPNVNTGGVNESYGYLPGDLNEKFEPFIVNFSQYFDRYTKVGFKALRDNGIVKILPLGFIRGIDAENTIIIADETQNTTELVSLVTRKANNSKIILLGDTSSFQLDLNSATTDDNGLSNIIELLTGASFFQSIEMKTLSHILRGAEVREIVRRLYNKYGENPKNWK